MILVIKSLQINDFDLQSPQVNFQMHCISSSKPCLVGNGDRYNGQSKMARQTELITWMLVQSTTGLCPFNYNLCHGALEGAPAAAAHLQLREEVLGPGCCVSTLLPPIQLSIPDGKGSNVKLFFCRKFPLPSGKARLRGSVFLRLGRPCSLWRLLSPALLSSM